MSGETTEGIFGYGPSHSVVSVEMPEDRTNVCRWATQQ